MNSRTICKPVVSFHFISLQNFQGALIDLYSNLVLKKSGTYLKSYSGKAFRFPKNLSCIQSDIISPFFQAYITRKSRYANDASVKRSQAFKNIFIDPASEIKGTIYSGEDLVANTSFKACT